ncbi:hypothetical protein O0S10_01615 [Methanocorpusculum sp. MG]|uniref:Uncharacterized protein n=1 Tax=Methanocorpusculum petauri TaxID=3002863 RepID=A0ABT4IEZ1_9EURY|nr:hypothetical protein [Methanocorpusculum petauri]MCZ0859924.1 hypothetical protein [Methanocorpusculum petauri]
MGDKTLKDDEPKNELNINKAILLFTLAMLMVSLPGMYRAGFQPDGPVGNVSFLGYNGDPIGVFIFVCCFLCVMILLAYPLIYVNNLKERYKTMTKIFVWIMSNILAICIGVALYGGYYSWSQVYLDILSFLFPTIIVINILTIILWSVLAKIINIE